MEDLNGLTEKEQKTLKKAQEELKKIPLILCTTCNYCAKKYVSDTTGDFSSAIDHYLPIVYGN